MDKFENIIKQAVEGYEAPFNPQAWENVSNELGDSFDQQMKDSTNAYEAPFNPAAWEAVSSQLGATYSAWKWIGGSAAIIAIVAGASYFFSDTIKENQSAYQPNNEVVVYTNDLANNNTTAGFETNNNTNNSTASNELIENNNENNVDNNQVVQHVIPNVVNNNDNSHHSGNDINQHNGEPNTQNNDQVSPNGVQNLPVVNDVLDYRANAKFSMSADEICQGGTCVFTPSDINTDLIYVWNFGDGGLSSSVVGNHKFKRAGEFTVTLDIKHPKTNKTISTNSKSITVNELPKANFSWEQSTEAIPTVSFINLTNEAVTWQWNINGLKQANNNEFEYTFRKAGNYVVGLTATSEFGCVNTIEKTIEIEKDYNLLAPTAFTPNGDGENDKFIPQALKMLDVEFTMTILDKNGKQVYVTQNAFEPWDGRFTIDNTMAPAGSSYIWRVVLVNSNGEQELYEGQVFAVY